MRESVRVEWWNDGMGMDKSPKESEAARPWGTFSRNTWVYERFRTVRTCSDGKPVDPWTRSRLGWEAQSVEREGEGERVVIHNSKSQ